MTNIYQKFGERVRELRKERGLSQEQLAEKVKMDVRTIVAIETGKRNPTLKTINKITKIIKTDISKLF
jgi:transcriptional regulator with XRE-family HTH domain